MKKIFNILIVSVLLLSACTLTVPALFGVSIVKVEYQDLENLAVYLRNAGDGYTVKIGDTALDCSFDQDDQDLLVCIGGGFEPGEDLVIKFFDDENGDKPLAELTFVAPDYPAELQDTDDDGVPNAEDLCPTDSRKSSPGVCGCGLPDTDSDGDGTPNCEDAYPEDPTKTKSEPSEDEETEKDTDEDGTPDSQDQCSEDPEKTEPGECGCGTPDADGDEDGIVDCNDRCPSIAYEDKIGDPCDKDEDNDGVFDGADQCPYDPFKFKAGYCGCGKPETDTDKDGTPDCKDLCPENPEKIKPGESGCDDECSVDTDEDGTPDCEDCCPEDENKIKPGYCGCGE